MIHINIKSRLEKEQDSRIKGIKFGKGLISMNKKIMTH